MVNQRPEPPWYLPPKRRESQRTYLIRRAVALALLAALTIGLIALGKAAFGGGNSAEPSTSSSASVTSVAAQPGDSTVTSLSGTGTGPGGAPVTVLGTNSTLGAKTPFVPSSAQKAKVLVVGDADVATFGPYLQKLLRHTGIVETALSYSQNSGLARPDYYDWVSKLPADLAQMQADIVVIAVGGNDAQGLTDVAGKVVADRPGGANDEPWRTEYAARVGALMDVAMAANIKVVWVGVRNHATPEVSARLQVQDEVVRAEVAKRAGLSFVDGWKLFAAPNGGYIEFTFDPRDGEGKDVRAGDGYHLTPVGGEILALKVYEAVGTLLANMGAGVPNALDTAKAIAGG